MRRRGCREGGGGRRITEAIRRRDRVRMKRMRGMGKVLRPRFDTGIVAWQLGRERGQAKSSCGLSSLLACGPRF